MNEKELLDSTSKEELFEMVKFLCEWHTEVDALASVIEYPKFHLSYPKLQTSRAFNVVSRLGKLPQDNKILCDFFTTVGATK